MHLLLTHIRELFQIETGTERKSRVAGQSMSVLPSIKDAWLYIEDGKIHSFGPMSDPPGPEHLDDQINLEGRLVLPAWVDSHTHLVFAASRESEFEDRIRGMSYEEIARRGGGILNSARHLAEASEEELFDLAWQRLEKITRTGTGSLEIKSGYGLHPEAEWKMLRVIRRLKEKTGRLIKASFLAAHAYPAEYKNNHEGYIRLIIDEMLPRIQDEGLADYMDIFCEKGFFSVDETRRLLEAGWKYGLKPKIHANQLHHSGGVEIGVAMGAVSVDHLECVGPREIEVLKGSDTIPTLLPGAAFFLGLPYPPARAMIDAGLPVALASDYNPGSCPSGNIPQMLTLACTQQGLLPAEAIHAVTLNGAAALEIQDEVGSIAPGKRADLIITHPIPSLAYIPYDFGNNPVDRVLLDGHWV